MQYTVFKTAFGPCAIAWTESGLTRVQLPEKTRLETEERIRDAGAKMTGSPLPAFVQDAIVSLQAYFSGDDVSFDTLVLDDSTLLPFNANVYRLLRAVPRGTTITYGELATRADRPGAAQAVGVAMSRNPWPVVVPCHRVIGANGKLTGFSAYGGVQTKLKLLAMEGTPLGFGPGLFDHLP